MSEVAGSLHSLVKDELLQPGAPPGVHALCDAVRERHGSEVAAVLFYGSCLRKSTTEGVLDFYVVVDSYRAIYGPGLLAAGNSLLPPNVFYLAADCDVSSGPEASDEPGAAVRRETLRCKYAVISLSDFEHCTSPTCMHSYIWARFSQPARLAYIRDQQSREAVVRCVAESIVTLVQRLGPFLPAKGRIQRFSIAALWKEAFRRTYGAELRPESSDHARELFAVNAERYEVAGMAALEILAERGWLDAVTPRGGAVEIAMKPSRRTRERWRWLLARPLAKGLALLRLLKTATTFGDWLPYVLWKLERHTGERIELTERQRRRPLIYGWPVLFRLIRQRSLR